MKAPVDRTKQHRDLKLSIYGLCRIANEYLWPFEKKLKITSGFAVMAIFSFFGVFPSLFSIKYESACRSNQIT